MRFDDQIHRIGTNHWLVGVRKSFCQNYNNRPGNFGDISLIVIHCISLPPGEYGGDSIDRLFANKLDPSAHPYFIEIKNMRVSAHLLIRRDGEVVQYVAFDKRAWHAGASVYQGRENCNDFSIGIELEGVDDGVFEQVQYDQLSAVCRALIQHYPSLGVDKFAAHSDIAIPIGRKSDPGIYFDWSKFKAKL